MLTSHSTENLRTRPDVIYTGGQIGADQAGWLAALHLGIQTGGWMPKGGRIDDGDGGDAYRPELLIQYGALEHESHEYSPRTIRNVLKSSGTVWFGYTESGGGQLTIWTARDLEKPLIINPNPEELRLWVGEKDISILNVAGSASPKFNPNIFEEVYDKIMRAFSKNLPPTKPVLA